MIRTLIIDDEPAIRRDLQRLLARHEGFIEVGACGSIAEGLVLIPATRPDLVLLDIRLSDGLSFDLLAQLRDITFKIIFITAYSDGALRAIKSGALDYVLKPIDEDEFAGALGKAREYFQHGPPADENRQTGFSPETALQAIALRRIALRTHQFVAFITIQDIIYCSGNGGYTTFHLQDGRKLVASKPLKDYEELLPEQLFLRPHQSYLVQKSYVERFQRDGMLILKDKTEIPVATRRRESILQLLTT